MKNFSLISLLLALSLPTSSIAELINNDSHTTDTISGLDWLDLSYTTKMSYTDALSNNPGWRYATKDEVANLFETIFTGYYDTSVYGTSSSSDGAYTNQEQDVEKFKSLFGPTLSYPSYSYTYGMYSINQYIVRRMGVYITETDSFIYGMNNTDSLNSYRDTGWSDRIGTYLVRSTPLPTTNDLISNLINDVITLNLQRGISSALDHKLDTILHALEVSNVQSGASVTNMIYSFIYSVEAQRGNHITDEQADTLIMAAYEIIESLEDK